MATIATVSLLAIPWDNLGIVGSARPTLMGITVIVTALLVFRITTPGLTAETWRRLEPWLDQRETRIMLFGGLALAASLPSVAAGPQWIWFVLASTLGGVSIGSLSPQTIPRVASWLGKRPIFPAIIASPFIALLPIEDRGQHALVLLLAALLLVPVPTLFGYSLKRFPALLLGVVLVVLVTYVNRASLGGLSSSSSLEQVTAALLGESGAASPPTLRSGDHAEILELPSAPCGALCSRRDRAYAGEKHGVAICERRVGRGVRKQVLSTCPQDTWDDRRWTVDHIIPLSLGGSNGLDNLQCLSEEDNQAKNRLEQQALQLVNERHLGLDTAWNMVCLWRR